MDDTIFAQASAHGRAGVAVFRVSGPQAFVAGRALAGDLPPPRQAALRWIRDPATGEPLDRGLVLAFPGPGSFTGEDCLELHLHGSVAVARSLFSALRSLPGLRLAAAGEFTRRALMNGRLDLSQVEGLADLVGAETAAQQAQALAVMNGSVSRLIDGWRRDLTQALALTEAGIDFADEELPDDLLDAIRAAVSRVAAAMRREAAGFGVAERVRDGFEVALVGPPNAGKSTLLNAIARRDVAITAPTAGTTRDILEVRLDVDGLPLTLLDMAGMRETDETVESLGVARARARARDADLRIFLLEDVSAVDALGVPVGADDIVLRGKDDAGEFGGVSGATGAGISMLLQRIGAALRERVAGAGSVAHARQRAAIEEAIVALDAAGLSLEGGEGSIDLAAEELRAALRALDLVVGRVDIEGVLDVIFASFCLGK